MVHFVFTPWRNRAELLLVRQQLFPAFITSPSSATAAQPKTPSHHQPWWSTPAQLTALEHALARVFLWTHRGACPHVVESTALLLSAIVLDSRSTTTNAPSFPSSSDAVAQAAVTSAYVVAFTRFVTGLLDSQQDKARKLSMYGVARTLGLPAAFVELRHQGTHEPMPGLGQLRPAARAALGWIWEYYWRHLGEGDGEVRTAGDGGKVKGGESSGGGGSGSRVQGAAVATADMDALKGRMCRRALLEYLQRRETVGAAREGLMRQLKQWEMVLVVGTLVELGSATKDRNMLVRAVELARTILGEEEDEEAEKETDEAALRQELMLALSKAEKPGETSSAQASGWGKRTGKRKMGTGEEEEDGEPERKRGGWFKDKGPWVPRSIGTL